MDVEAQRREPDSVVRRVLPWLPFALAVPVVLWALSHDTPPARTEPRPTGPPGAGDSLPDRPAVRSVTLSFVDDQGRPAPQSVFFLTWEPVNPHASEDVALQWGFHRSDDDGLYIVDPVAPGATLSVEILDPELRNWKQTVPPGTARVELTIQRLTAEEKQRLQAIDAEIRTLHTKEDRAQIQKLRAEQERIRRGNG